MELKEHIITEANRMFYEQGIKSVRMDDIALSCGISKRTLYEIFTDREDLIRQSIEYSIDKHEKRIINRLQDAGNVIDEFWELFESGVDFTHANIKVFGDLLKFYPQIFGTFMRCHHKTVVEDNRRRLEKGIKEGFILKNINTEFMARAFTNYIYGLRKDLGTDFISYKSDSIPSANDNIENIRALQFSILLFFRGMTTEKGRRYIDETYLKELNE